MWCMKIFRFVITIATGVAMVSCSSHQEAPTEATPDVPAKAEAKEKRTQEGEKATAETSSEEETQAREGEQIAPTEEQQAAAEKMLSESAALEADEESLDVLPEPIGNEEVLDDVVPNTSGIPGRNALRMGQYAPPEEAASASSARPPRPNRVEQHGFRSPSLPSKLPMDINGKLTGEGKN